MTYDVTSYGEIGLRLSPAGGRSLARTDLLSVNVIGTEFNVLANLASLGWKTALLSAVPDTPMGERARSTLRQFGVNDQLIDSTDADQRIGIYFVDYGVAPKPTSVYFDRKNTAFTLWDPDQRQFESLLDTKILHLSGLSLALSDLVADVSSRLLEQAKSRGVTVCFDLNHRRKLWSAERAAQVSIPFIEQADVLIAPNADVNELFNRSASALENLDYLAGLSGAAAIAITDGERGAVARIRDQLLSAPSAEVEIVDRLGAGDGFAAGFLHALASERQELALISGTHFAALALAQQGEQVSIQRSIFEQILTGNAGRLQR